MITRLPNPCDALSNDAVEQHIKPAVTQVDRLASRMLHAMIELMQDLGTHATEEDKALIKTHLYDRLIMQLHEDSEELTRNPNYYTTYKGA